MKTFKCSQIEDTWYLDADYRLECYGSEWLDHMPFALVGVLLYPIGIPAFVYISLLLNKKYLHHDVKSMEDDLENALEREDLLIQLIEKVDGKPDDQIVLACLKASAHVKELSGKLEQVFSTCL